MTKHTQLQLETKEIDEENYTVRGVFSTDDKDADGEVVDQGGWVLDDYMKNPTVLFAHKSHEPPVGKMVQIGYNDNGNLEGKIKFAAEEYDFAETIFNLYAGGYMRGFSAGFMNLDAERRDGTRVLTENKLKEVSTVPIPANANALAKAKEKGIDTEALEKRVRKAFDLSTFEQKTVNFLSDIYEASADDFADMWEEFGEVSSLSEKEFAEYIADMSDSKTTGEVLNFFENDEKDFAEVVEKEGRVLAQENREAVEDARDALNEVLERDNQSQSESADKSSIDQQSPEGETPDAGQGGNTSEQPSVREVNRQIRSLLKKKKDIKS